jgi:outer membrane protein OmpA-like peptidoglycan-associated protein
MNTRVTDLLVRAALVLLGCVVGLSAAIDASAQETRFSIENFYPNTNPRTGLAAVSGASLLGPRATETTILGSYGWAPLTLVDGEDGTAGKLLSSVVGLHVMTSVGVTDWLEIGVDLPIMFMGAGDSIQGFRDEPLESDTVALGMIRVVPRIRLAGKERTADSAGFGLTMILDTSLPTGNVDAYAGDDGFRMDPMIAADVKFRRGPALMANVGYRLRPATSLGVLEVDDALTFGAGADFPVVGILHLAGEVFGSMLVAGPASTEEIPVEALGSVRLVGDRWLGQFGAGSGLTGGFGAMDYRFISSVGYHSMGDPDADHDGLRRSVDTCPRAAEDRDGFEDDDGCPDPDNDQDGISDSDDACPDEAGVVAAQGCPAAPGIADMDGDSVADEFDRCPSEPGPATNEGCPENDRDGDMVADLRDRCPDEPGPVSNNGCPEADAAEYLAVVPFAFDTADLSAEGRGTLDSLAARLERYESSARIEVVGHTDAIGVESYNVDLSQTRADVVRDYLISIGVDASRIDSRGAGASEPINSNTTQAGRAENRRAEVRIRPSSAE